MWQKPRKLCCRIIRIQGPRSEDFSLVVGRYPHIVPWMYLMPHAPTFQQQVHRKSRSVTTDTFLSVTDRDQIGDDDTSIYQLQDWKKSGPLGKLHNLLCVKIHVSPQLLAKFKTLSKGLTLLQDNATRWGSRFKLIERRLHL